MKTVLNGILVGIANSIPGVSGGTILVLTNILEKTLNAIQNPWKNRVFLIKLTSGIVIGLLLFSNLISYSLSMIRIPTFYLFIGLVLGGTIVFYQKEIKSTMPVLIAAGIALVVFLDNMLWFSGEHFLLLLLGGILAGASTILPGISGSLILLILHQYEPVIGYVKEFSRLEFLHWFDLLYFGLGGILGLYFMSILLLKLLKTHKLELMNVILGLLIGSTLVLVPIQSYGSSDFLSILTLPLGIWLGLKFK